MQFSPTTNVIRLASTLCHNWHGWMLRGFSAHQWPLEMAAKGAYFSTSQTALVEGLQLRCALCCGLAATWPGTRCGDREGEVARATGVGKIYRVGRQADLQRSR